MAREDGDYVWIPFLTTEEACELAERRSRERQRKRLIEGEELKDRIDRLFADKSDLFRNKAKAEVSRLLEAGAEWDERKAALTRLCVSGRDDGATWTQFKGWLSETIAKERPDATASTADWHRADIVAALRKRGWSLRRLGVSCGLSANSLKSALDKPWPNGEQIIADAIGVAPEHIWPSRYADPSHHGEQTHRGNESKDRGRR